MRRRMELDVREARESVGILINSRTVVESGDYVSTGLLTYAEGDLIEIETAEYQRFHLGDAAKVTIYSPGGIYMFHTSIVAKDEGNLVVLNPPANQTKFVDRREHPRVDIANTGYIRSYQKPTHTSLIVLDKPVTVELRNISVTGVGFVLTEEIELEPLEPEQLMAMEFELGDLIPCKAEVVRQEKREDGGMYFGARFIDIPSEKLNTLRAFILRTQIEERLKHKKKETKKFK